VCGIAGFTTGSWPASERQGVVARRRLAAMTGALQHRGPDALRAMVVPLVALGHARLSILDIECGSQPMCDPETHVCVVFNGEIFNYVELRSSLNGYRFRTRSDTEVILAAYARWGMDCVNRFIGQWAFALWDPATRELHLSRDRLGVRPLYYVETAEGVAFASEIKAIFAGDFVRPELDPLAIKATTCLWSTVAPRTTFSRVLALPPGCNATVRDEKVHLRRYWRVDLADSQVDHALTRDKAAALVGDTLEDAVRLRLRADVPVAAYLSGGLDSSLICALAQRQLRTAGRQLATFSLAFENAAFDESEFQREVASALDTAHSELCVSDAEIGRSIPQVIQFAEQPLVRSAPAPLLALSRMVQKSGIKVVLTGEGADEFFLGYQIFQETKIRQFWAKQPESKRRPIPLRRLYPYLRVADQGSELQSQFFRLGLEDPTQPGFSHLLRWSSTSRIWRFFSLAFENQTRSYDPIADLLAGMPPDFERWRPLARAQYLEISTLLSGYLLSAQGDRMLMANSVEGRFPFLDHRLVELSARLPDPIKLRVLDEKHVLKAIASSLIPDRVIHRPKRPYRAPVSQPICGVWAAGWSTDALHEDAIREAGVFDPVKVQRLREKLSRSPSPGESDSMALMAIASVQLLHGQFVRSTRLSPDYPEVHFVDARVDKTREVNAAAGR